MDTYLLDDTLSEKLSTSTDLQPTTRHRAIYVAPDCTDSAVQKRARGFINQGIDLLGFSFRRTRYNQGYQPDWPNIELGKTTERKLLTRIFVLIRALRIFYAHRRTWRAASFIYARNLDLALLTLLGKAITFCRAPFVYEALDIHPALTSRGMRGRLARWIERRVLARSQMLVVSSPAFLRNYFQPIQRYQGESFLLENKWPDQQMCRLPRKIPCTVESPVAIWTIGWFGNIRCQQSLEMLAALADAIPDRVRIYICGYASLLGEQRLAEVIRRRDNMVYKGEYIAPDELPMIYANVHFNWCVDFGDGDNSQWLLPNRLYEGGYFGVPALAMASHETGRVVRQRGLGIPIESPPQRFLRELLLNMERNDYLQMRHRIESLPVSHFVDQGEIGQLVERMLSRKQPGDFKADRRGERPHQSQENAQDHHE